MHLPITGMSPTSSASLAAGAAWMLVFMVLPDVCNGHGMLTVPPARNWLAYVNDNYYWPDGNNAGGYAVVGQNGAVKWPNGKHSLCGDSMYSGNQPFMKAGPVVATYTQGQTIEVHIMITTNHYGRFELRLCPAGATSDNQCQKLQRADGKGVTWDLPMVVQGSRFNGGALGDNLRPMEVDNFYTWYKQPQVKCKFDPYCSRYSGYPVYKLKYKLPNGFKCEKCILQWYYLTGHKCHPPCLKSDRYFPDCRSNPKYRGTYLATMDYCGTQWSAYPEEFRNCADIRIK